MIRVRSNLDQVRAELAGAEGGLPEAIDSGISAGLDALIAAVVPVTPVRSGDMARGYRKQGGGGRWQLVNEMFYTGYVVGGTRHIRPNAAINAVLDRAPEYLARALEASIAAVAH